MKHRRPTADTTSAPAPSFVTSDELQIIRDRDGYYFLAWALAIAFFALVPPALKSVWPRLVDAFGNDESLTGMCLLALLVTQVPNLGQHVVWNAVMWPIYFGYFPSLDKYRIDPRPWPWTSPDPKKRTEFWDVCRRAVWRVVVINNGVVGIPALLLLYIRLHRRGFFPITMEHWPSTPVLVLQILGALVVEDAFFYWSHRTLHSPALYARIHKVHHQFNHNVVLASENAHPVEFVIGNLNPVLMGGLLTNMHLATFGIWIFVRIFVSADEHCGYRFPWSPCRLLPFQASAEAHDFHHSQNTGVYAAQFTWWDRFLGTDRTFLEFRHKELLHQHKAAAEHGAKRH